MVEGLGAVVGGFSWSAGRTEAAELRWTAGRVDPGTGTAAGAGRGGAVGASGRFCCAGASAADGSGGVLVGTGPLRTDGAGRGASAGVGAGAGGVEAVVVQPAPGARRVRRTTGRRWTGALGVPPGVPGPAGETGPGTFWGRSAPEGSGAAVAAAAGASPFPGVGAGAGLVGAAAPTGARRRGGCTGRAEVSGERRTGPGGAAPAATGLGASPPVAFRDDRAGSPVAVTARRTGGAGTEASAARAEPPPRTGAVAAPSRTGADAVPFRPAGTAAAR
ncbi:hypothetical protein [Streptomyces cinereoruber]|uniref:hypothetical protein n=1 Tax=Streptomyces cinereoruber TaxID=67260 RepID=UPI00339466D7